MSAEHNVHGRRECGKHALEALDSLLAERTPDSIQRVLPAVARSLVRYRDALIAESRERNEAGVSQELSRANAVLSLLFGIQYPLEGVHWDRLEIARNAFAALHAMP